MKHPSDALLSFNKYLVFNLMIEEVQDISILFKQLIYLGKELDFSQGY